MKSLKDESVVVQLAMVHEMLPRVKELIDEHVDEIEQLREMEKYFYLHAPMEYQAYLNGKEMK